MASQLGFILLAAIALVAYRAVPFALWALVRAGTPALIRVLPCASVMLIAYALASAGMDVTEIWFRAPVTVAYFTVLAMLLFECRIWLSSAWGHAALIVGLPIVYVAVPAIAGNGATMVATVIFGWERMLAAYSFFREHRDQGDAPYREALFFLTVDPSIVWPDRAKRDPDGRRDLAQVGDRVALGSVQLASQTLVLLLLVPGPGQPSDLLTDVTDAKSYFQFVVAHLIVFASVFLAHAGLANVQIGFVELAGMRVGERYRRPYVSTSPRDFWRRWNVWVANWARRYVYQPVVRFIDGRSRWKSRRRGRAVAVFVTFVVMGLLHDVAYAATFPRTSVPLPGLIVFLLFGVLTLSWHVVTPRVQVHGPASRLAAGLVGWLLLVQVVAVAIWVAQPLMRDGTLPRSLQNVVEPKWVASVDRPAEGAEPQ